MKQRILLWSFLLFLTLTTVNSFLELNSIEDLRKVDNNSLPLWFRLLYWLASNINIDNNGIISLSGVVIRASLGAHVYHNGENVLPVIYGNQRYFSLGNLNLHRSLFPDYVIDAYNNQRTNAWRNRQRIILRVNAYDEVVNPVYITQHYPPNSEYNSAYDPDNTYIITPNLLREIRTFQTSSAHEIREQYGIYVNEQNIQSHHGRIFMILHFLGVNNRDNNGWCVYPSNSARKNRRRDVSDEECENLKIVLGLGTTCTGKARIHWSNIPEKYFNQGVMLALYKNSDRRLTYTEISKASGNFDTPIDLGAGLEVRLHKETYEQGWIFKQKVPGEEIWRGPEFHDANRVNPVQLHNYDTFLQLFVSEGHASARLYIKNTFADWKDVFKNSWVGFYANDNKDTQNDYYTYEWAMNFNKESQADIPDYDVYVYKSNRYMCPGSQARFMLTKSGEEKARTLPWELQTPAPVDINGYAARLQLYSKDSHASARLFIKKSFTDWKTVFENSWVGFHSDEHKDTNGYNSWQWQWVVEFTKEIRSDFPDYDVYVYESSMTMSHGVQARFMLTKSGEEMARTLPWEGFVEKDELR